MEIPIINIRRSHDCLTFRIGIFVPRKTDFWFVVFIGPMREFVNNFKRLAIIQFLKQIFLPLFVYDQMNYNTASTRTYLSILEVITMWPQSVWFQRRTQIYQNLLGLRIRSIVVRSTTWLLQMKNDTSETFERYVWFGRKESCFIFQWIGPWMTWQYIKKCNFRIHFCALILWVLLEKKGFGLLPQNIIDDKTKLVQVIAWCHPAMRPEPMLTQIHLTIWRH